MMILIDGGSEDERCRGFGNELSSAANVRFGVSSLIQRTRRAWSRSHCQFPLKVLKQAGGEMGVIPLACTLGRFDLCSTYDRICGFRISVWKGVLLEYLPT